MKRAVLKLALITIVAFSLSGCALLYNDLKTPLPSLSVSADTESRTSVGQASRASSVWGVAVGDCSVATDMKNVSIMTVYHVDSEFRSFFFGIYSTFTTVVYGE